MRRLLVLLGLLAGCAEAPPDPLAGPPSPRGDSAVWPARVLVVNTLSETLSALDLDSGILTPRAADLGALPNRITRLPGNTGVLVTASGDNAVAVLSFRDLALLGEVDVGRGSNPWLAVPVNGSIALVTNWLSGDVRRVDLAGAGAGPRLPVTRGPEGVAVASGRAFVACTNWSGPGAFGEGRLDVVELDAWRVSASVPVGRNPQDVLVDDQGRVHVLCTGTFGQGPDPEAGSVHVVDPGALVQVGTVDLGGSPGRIAAGPDGEVWVAGFSGGLRRYDEESLGVLSDPADPALRASGLSALAWDAATGTAYVTNFERDLLLAVDGATLEITGVWVVGDGPVDVLVLRAE